MPVLFPKVRLKKAVLTTPTAPTILSITNTSNTLTVYFYPPEGNGGTSITNYEFSVNNGSTFTARSPASVTNPIVITGLANGTVYPVRIRAVNSVGAGSQSNAMNGTPAALPVPLAFWNMEGVPPNNQTDNSGNERTLSYAVMIVDATSVAGKIGNAVSFNATDLPFNMGEGARYYTQSWGVDVENDFSMSVWMRTRNFSSYSHIIGAPFQNGFYIGANETENTFNLFNGTVFGITAPTVAANTWVHYVFIRSGNILLLYANNTLVGSVDITGESFPNASVFSVGGGEYNEYYYDGDIDALGFWNAALNADQVAYLYNSGTGRQWPLN